VAGTAVVGVLTIPMLRRLPEHALARVGTGGIRAASRDQKIHLIQLLCCMAFFIGAMSLIMAMPVDSSIEKNP